MIGNSFVGLKKSELDYDDNYDFGNAFVYYASEYEPDVNTLTVKQNIGQGSEGAGFIFPGT